MCGSLLFSSRTGNLLSPPAGDLVVGPPAANPVPPLKLGHHFGRLLLQILLHLLLEILLLAPPAANPVQPPKLGHQLGRLLLQILLLPRAARLLQIAFCCRTGNILSPTTGDIVDAACGKSSISVSPPSPHASMYSPLSAVEPHPCIHRVIHESLHLCMSP